MLAFFVSLFVLVAPTRAEDLDVLAHTPVGSWQVREEVRTDHRGKESVTIVKTSLLEELQGPEGKQYWIEMSTRSFKVKSNSDRKEQGEPVVLKVLVDADALKTDSKNLLNNLAGIGREILMQTGDGPPMRMREGGLLGNAAMEALGTQIAFEFEPAGSETVKTPAGTFTAQKFEGTADVDMKVLMRRIHIESETQSWYAPEVPFGTVRAVSDAVVDGKKEHTESVLVEMATSGAASQITGEPVDMPTTGIDLGGLKDVFGGGR